MNISSLLESLNRKLRIVEIDYFYDHLADPKHQAFLGKIAHFKIHSYQADYPYGILPFGAHDLIGTHLLLCEEEDNGNLEPLVGLKAVTLNQCERFGLSFPALQMIAEDPKAKSLYQEVEKWLIDASQNNREVGYFGSWTVRPDFRKKKIGTKICTYLTAALGNFWSRERQISHLIAFAIKSHNIGKFHKFLGFHPLSKDGVPLPGCLPRSFFGETLEVSVTETGMSEETRQIALDIQKLWDTRVQIVSQKNTQEKEAA